MGPRALAFLSLSLGCVSAEPSGTGTWSVIAEGKSDDGQAVALHDVAGNPIALDLLAFDPDVGALLLGADVAAGEGAELVFQGPASASPGVIHQELTGPAAYMLAIVIVAALSVTIRGLTDLSIYVYNQYIREDDLEKQLRLGRQLAQIDMLKAKLDETCYQRPDTCDRTGVALIVDNPPSCDSGGALCVPKGACPSTHLSMSIGGRALCTRRP